MANNLNTGNITPILGSLVSNTKTIPSISMGNIVKTLNSLNILIMPGFALNQPQGGASASVGCILSYNGSNFNCEEDFFYKFRVEDIKEGRSVTIRGVRLIYRNIGQVTLEVGVEVFCKETNTFNYVGQIQTLGTLIPDNKLYTINYDLINTGERPQVILYRKALQGALAISSATIFGEGIEGDPV